ncbi:MAG: hypothetical protein HY303_18680 [Candidatus Wallbacteria bacterium]|nr:hypothetical protein [Candidatus Wallbacteria bacterium]
MTLEAGRELRGNPHGVRRPAQTEDDVVLFENSVDLGLATLRRQMIRSKDGEGRSLYGLREIFVRTPSARR